jgi:hypothetical protein
MRKLVVWKGRLPPQPAECLDWQEGGKPPFLTSSLRIVLSDLHASRIAHHGSRITNHESLIAHPESHPTDV